MSLDYVKTLAGEGHDSEQLLAVYNAIKKRLSTRLSRSFVKQGHLANDIDKMVSDGLETLDYVIDEVTLSRWNVIGSEHMESEDVDGHKIKFISNDIFKQYEDDIQDYVDDQAIDDTLGRNVVRFL